MMIRIRAWDLRRRRRRRTKSTSTTKRLHAWKQCNSNDNNSGFSNRERGPRCCCAVSFSLFPVCTEEAESRGALHLLAQASPRPRLSLFFAANTQETVVYGPSFKPSSRLFRSLLLLCVCEIGGGGINNIVNQRQT